MFYRATPLLGQTNLIFGNRAVAVWGRQLTGKGTREPWAMTEVFSMLTVAVAELRILSYSKVPICLAVTGVDRLCCGSCVSTLYFRPACPPPAAQAAWAVQR